LIQVDEQYRKLFFYHHRKDGLIYREEQIGNKVQEFFKGREDKLEYRSVKFDDTKTYETEVDMSIEDKTYGKFYVIKKMTQKFELDPSKPAEEQIRKTVFMIDQANPAKDKVLIHYHYKEG